MRIWLSIVDVYVYFKSPISVTSSELCNRTSGICENIKLLGTITWKSLIRRLIVSTHTVVWQTDGQTDILLSSSSYANTSRDKKAPGAAYSRLSTINCLLQPCLVTMSTDMSSLENHTLKSPSTVQVWVPSRRKRRVSNELHHRLRGRHHVTLKGQGRDHNILRARYHLGNGWR